MSVVAAPSMGECARPRSIRSNSGRSSGVMRTLRVFHTSCCRNPPLSLTAIERVWRQVALVRRARVIRVGSVDEFVHRSALAR